MCRILNWQFFLSALWKYESFVFWYSVLLLRCQLPVPHIVLWRQRPIHTSTISVPLYLVLAVWLQCTHVCFAIFLLLKVCWALNSLAFHLSSVLCKPHPSFCSYTSTCLLRFLVLSGTPLTQIPPIVPGGCDRPSHISLCVPNPVFHILNLFDHWATFCIFSSDLYCFFYTS